MFIFAPCSGPGQARDHEEGPKRLIWNAGAATAVTMMLTLVASIASGPGHPARATPATLQVAQGVDQPHRRYASLAEHFEAANTTHDGRLTVDQASRAGWARIVRHFGEIDTGHLGFVTAAQIHAYNVGQRHGRRVASEA